MKIKVYLTKEDYQKWLSGEEIMVNNVAEETDGFQGGLVTKMEAFIDENELLSIEKETFPNELGKKMTCYWYTIKREKGPKGKFV